MSFIVPKDVNRVLFCIRKKPFGVKNFLEQVVDTPGFNQVIVEINILPEGSSTMEPGQYMWFFYAIRGDGTRDTVHPLNEGEIDFINEGNMEELSLLIPENDLPPAYLDEKTSIIYC